MQNNIENSSEYEAFLNLELRKRLTVEDVAFIARTVNLSPSELWTRLEFDQGEGTSNV